MEDKIICKICEKEFKNGGNAFGLHLKKEHNISRKEYFDTHVEPYFHKCPCCEKERLWHSTSYRITCGSKECKQKNFEMVCLEKYGVKNPSSNKEIQDKKGKTKLKRYGDENYNNREKCKQTSLEHFGTEHPLQSEKIKQKIKDTNLEKYGVEYGLQNENVKQKIRKTCLEKYGCEYANQSDIIKQKIKDTNLEKYGVEYYSQTDEFKERLKQTCLEKYGEENPSYVKAFKEKIKKTKLERYGDENYCNVKQIKQTILERYGETSYAKTRTFAQQKRYKIYEDGIGFDSQLEVNLYKWCKQNNINVIVHPEPIEYIDNNHIKHFYHPDFLINKKIVECKGRHFLKYDKKGIICGLQNPFTSNLTEEEKLIDKCKQEAKYKCMVTHNVLIITNTNDFNLI